MIASVRSGAVDDLSVSTEGGWHIVHSTETSSCVRMENDSSVMALGHQDEQLLRERRPDMPGSSLVA